MQIVITVSDFDELKAIARQILGTEQVEQPAPTAAKAAPAKKAAKEPKEPAPAPAPVETFDEAPEGEELPFAPDQKQEPKQGPKQETEKTYSMVEVRKFLGDLRKAGKKEEVTALLEGMGYPKFTDVPEEKYAELMKKAEAI